MEKKPIEFRQLCALVKAEFQKDPGIDNGEWKARCRDTMARWGFQQPSTTTLVQAMVQVERALTKAMGQRQVREIPVAPPPKRPAPPPKEYRTHNPQGWEIVERLLADLQASALSRRRSDDR